MEKINLNLFFRMANIWFVFITLLYSGSQLPHWENVTVHAWVNEAFYFIMFLLSASIFIKSAHNKDIYLNTSLYLLVISFSFIVVFTGERYLFGNDFQAYSFLNYKTMTLCFLLNFIILFTSIRYFLPKMKLWIIYAAVSLILIPLFLIHFYPYLKESDFIFELGERYREDIQRRVFKTHLSSLAFLASYGLLLIKTNRTIGTYVHGLMISFALLLLTDMIGSLSIIYRFNASAISQVIITFNLLILFYCLFQKFRFISTDYGRFYEALIWGKIDLGSLQVERYGNKKMMWIIQVLKIYLSQRKNYLLFLFLVLLMILRYFDIPVFFIVNLLALVLFALLILWFADIIYVKRARQKHWMILNNNKHKS